MKKVLSLVLTAAIGVSCLAACSKEPAESETTATETAAQTTQAAPAVDTEVTPELNDLFEQALQGFVGVGYTPKFYLGSFDNGDTIHCFLCESTTITANPVSYWSFVFVLDDGAGNVLIAKVCQPDYASANSYDGDEVLATEVQTDSVPGGWEETMDYEVTDDMLAQFRVANSIYDPIALLATQVVSGTNYVYLCSDADGNLKFVVIYIDLDGTGCTLQSKLLNIESLY